MGTARGEPTMQSSVCRRHRRASMAGAGPWACRGASWAVLPLSMRRPLPGILPKTKILAATSPRKPERSLSQTLTSAPPQGKKNPFLEAIWGRSGAEATVFYTFSTCEYCKQCGLSFSVLKRLHTWDRDVSNVLEFLFHSTFKIHPCQ